MRALDETFRHAQNSNQQDLLGEMKANGCKEGLQLGRVRTGPPTDRPHGGGRWQTPHHRHRNRVATTGQPAWFHTATLTAMARVMASLRAVAQARAAVRQIMQIVHENIGVGVARKAVAGQRTSEAATERQLRCEHRDDEFATKLRHDTPQYLVIGYRRGPTGIFKPTCLTGNYCCHDRQISLTFRYLANDRRT